jgi:hypothetical protein
MAAMEQPQIDDIEEQIVTLRAALPIWRTEANDFVELAHNSEPAGTAMDERTLHRMRELLGATAGRHDTLLYRKKQDGARDLNPAIRAFRASPDAMPADVEAAAAMLPRPIS